VIVVAGEALIDLIGEDGTLRTHMGGGPFNTAVALGRLGVPVGFLGRLSNDRFGQLLRSHLTASGVDGRYMLAGAAPTPLAIVHQTADGDHEFTFYLDDTAYTDLAPSELPELGADVMALSAGTLALATDPPRTAIETLLERESQRLLIVIDPNIRPAVVKDRNAYRTHFERWAGFAHVIKLSDADAEWLYPGTPFESIVDSLLSRGVQLAIVTRGGEGAFARTATVRAEVAATAVEVIDTVGAGDAFVAGILGWLWTNDRLDAAAVVRLDAATLAEGLGFAAAVAGLQCSRAGATPPTLAEVEAFLA
jgi:fructokinase